MSRSTNSMNISKAAAAPGLIVAPAADFELLDTIFRDMREAYEREHRRRGNNPHPAPLFPSPSMMDVMEWTLSRNHLAAAKAPSLPSDTKGRRRKHTSRHQQRKR
jgi:hypothetical protein